MDATEVIAEMYAAHKAGNGAVGIDVEACVTGDRGVFDLLHTKQEAIKMATEAAITVLRVDQIIMSKPAGGPKATCAAPQEAHPIDVHTASPPPPSLGAHAPICAALALAPCRPVLPSPRARRPQGGANDD
eukprot:6219155-Prymnesium_polylepis.1